VILKAVTQMPMTPIELAVTKGDPVWTTVLKVPIRAEAVYINSYLLTKPWEGLSKTGELMAPSQLWKQFDLLQLRIRQSLTNWHFTVFGILYDLRLLIE